MFEIDVKNVTEDKQRMEWLCCGVNVKYVLTVMNAAVFVP